MGILKVARIGHPAIRTPSRPLTPEEIASPALQKLIDDMIDTMKDYDGVGLAAPQVHLDLQLAVIEVPARDERAEDAVPLTVLINPRVTKVGEETVNGWEGCLSIPELRGVVPRAKRVLLKALDREGRPFEVETEGFFARVIQHECDHLDGRVYLDRMPHMRSLTYLHEMEKYQHTDD
ncbi:MAG TPA: peptide deformylase [Vicinamibacteria bacterium]|nr:peptide deformylase [Vicinamibacteria bacterium]